MRTSSIRRVVVATVCITAALLPLAGAVVAGHVAWRLTTSGTAVLDPAAALLRLAAVGLAVVLLWAAAAVTAGSLDGWRRARSGGAVAQTRRPGRPAALASTAVAALVVAALTAPAAHAGVHPGSAAVVVAASVDRPDPDGPLDVRAAEDSPAKPSSDAAPVPGSWSGLAEPGFTAPRGVTPEAVGLVSSPATRTDHAPAEVVVTAGDTLWSLAAARLGPGASDAEVARAWPTWWEANREVIGDDPDLLLPGQRLVVPTA
jgi:nucleoid-associated protein YgaU